MQGILGDVNNGLEYKYFRIVFNHCDELDKKHDPKVKCKSEDERKKIFGKGRFFVYLFKYGEEDYTS